MMIEVYKPYKCNLVLTVDEFKHDQPLALFGFEGQYFITEVINTLLVKKSYKQVFDQAFYKGTEYIEKAISGKRSNQTQYWNEHSNYLDIKRFKEVIEDLKLILEEELRTGYRSYSFQTPVSEYLETVNNSLAFIEKYKTKKFRLYVEYDDSW